MSAELVSKRSDQVEELAKGLVDLGARRHHVVCDHRQLRRIQLDRVRLAKEVTELENLAQMQPCHARRQGSACPSTPWQRRTSPSRTASPASRYALSQWSPADLRPPSLLTGEDSSAPVTRPDRASSTRSTRSRPPRSRAARPTSTAPGRSSKRRLGERHSAAARKSPASATRNARAMRSCAARDRAISAATDRQVRTAARTSAMIASARAAFRRKCGATSRTRSRSCALSR